MHTFMPSVATRTPTGGAAAVLTRWLLRAHGPHTGTVVLPGYQDEDDEGPLRNHPTRDLSVICRRGGPSRGRPRPGACAEPGPSPGAGAARGTPGRVHPREGAPPGPRPGRRPHTAACDRPRGTRGAGPGG